MVTSNYIILFICRFSKGEPWYRSVKSKRFKQNTLQTSMWKESEDYIHAIMRESRIRMLDIQTSLRRLIFSETYVAKEPIKRWISRAQRVAFVGRGAVLSRSSKRMCGSPLDLLYEFCKCSRVPIRWSTVLCAEDAVRTRCSPCTRQAKCGNDTVTQRVLWRKMAVH